MVAGVAAGFADYFKTDVVIMRLIFVAIAFASFGFAVVGYLILIAVMPIDSSDKPHATSQPSERSRLYLGGALVGLGLLIAANEMVPGLIDLSWDLIWPLVIVLLGVWIIKGKGSNGK